MFLYPQPQFENFTTNTSSFGGHVCEVLARHQLIAGPEAYEEALTVLSDSQSLLEMLCANLSPEDHNFSRDIFVALQAFHRELTRNFEPTELPTPLFMALEIGFFDRNLDIIKIAELYCTALVSALRRQLDDECGQ